jgi:GTP-binding protein
LLVHVVDVAGSEGRDPLEDFDTINRELKTFNADLASRPMIVAGNKCDLATDEQLAAFEAAMKQRGYDYFPLMAAIAHGTQELVDCCAAKLAALPPIRAFEADPVPVQDVFALSNREVRIENHDGVFFVEGEWLLRLLQTIDLQEPDSLQYFEKVLQTTGVIQKLVDAGVQEGDTVSIYDLEFDFVF